MNIGTLCRRHVVAIDAEAIGLASVALAFLWIRRDRFPGRGRGLPPHVM